MFRRTRTALAVLVMAAVALVSGAAAPASAGTLEVGKVHRFPVTGADYDVYMQWDTSFNTVGTSSTQPFRVETRFHKCSLCAHRNFKSLRINFVDANGKNFGNHVYTCNIQAPPGSYTGCYPSGSNFDPADFKNIKLSSKPRVKLTFYSKLNGKGKVRTSGTIIYK